MAPQLAALTDQEYDKRTIDAATPVVANGPLWNRVCLRVYDRGDSLG